MLLLKRPVSHSLSLSLSPALLQFFSLFLPCLGFRQEKVWNGQWKREVVVAVQRTEGWGGTRATTVGRYLSFLCVAKVPRPIGVARLRSFLRWRFYLVLLFRGNSLSSDWLGENGDGDGKRVARRRRGWKTEGLGKIGVRGGERQRRFDQ